MDYSKINEWELSILHKESLNKEDYETCDMIQKEINNRIEKGTINRSLMNGFDYYNPNTELFENKKDKYKGLNGLFDKYIK